MNTGLNMASVKQKNRSIILHFIHACRSVSRSDIAKKTGLTPAAVTLITSSLVKEGMIQETGKSTYGSVGRKKVLLSLNPLYGNIVSVSITRGNTFISICDIEGTCLQQTQMQTESSPIQFLQKISNIIKQYQVQYKKLLGVSITVTGIVDEENGKSIKAYGIWDEEVDVCNLLQEQIHLPVILTNNVKAFTTAQLLFGKECSNQNLMMLKWGPGLGSVLVINEKVIQKDGFFSEVGHFLTDHNEILEKVLTNEELFNDSERLNQAIDLFARTIVNCSLLLPLEKIIVYGTVLEDDEIYRMLVHQVHAYQTSVELQRSDLYLQEEYIGCCAEFLERKVYV